MDHTEFDWDFENIRHIALDKVSPEEAEAVLSNPTMEVGSREQYGEVRYSEVGMTPAGRILFAAWTTRGKRIRVVTALEPSASLKRQFLEERGSQSQ